MALETLTVGQEGETLDLLLFRRFRREVEGLVEGTLALNPGLADLGPILPLWTRVLVEPPAPAPRGRKARPVVSLYD